MTKVDYSYSHFLFYKDERPAQAALAYVREEYDPSAEVLTGPGGYSCAVAFETSEEFGDDEAMQLVGMTSADEYDLNHYPGDDEDEDDEDEDDFPEVFTEHERSAALACAGDELTIEYIERLERVAEAAFAYYAKSQSQGYHGEPKLAHTLYEALATVNFMQP